MKSVTEIKSISVSVSTETRLTGFKTTTKGLSECHSKKKYTFNLPFVSLYFPGVVTVGELLRNETAFLVDVQKHMDFDPDALHLLMETILPNNNLEVSQEPL